MSRQQRAFLPGLVPDALRGVETDIQGCGLEKSLIELVKMRASQINGCAFCLDMQGCSSERRNGCIC
jgi:alkylhydroperoxidase family enzyme